jgi:hypothetical protein
MHEVLAFVSQIKITGEPSLVFSGQWFDFIRLPFKKYKTIMSWNNKVFEDLKDLLISFRLHL